MDEQAVIDLLANGTSINNDSEMVYTIHGWIQMLICFLSLVADLLIVTIMAKNKGANTRTNKVIMHFAIADAFNMFNEMGLLYFIYEKTIYNLYPYHRFYCVVAIFEITSIFASLLFIVTLLSNVVIKSTTFSDKTVLSVYYGIIGFVLALEALFCAFFHLNFHFFYTVNYLLFFAAFVLLLIKDIYRFYKFWKKRPLSQHTTFRLNVARIYLYCYFVNYLSYDMLFIYLFGYLAPVLIILFLAYSDSDFKISSLNLLKFQNNEATIKFSDECSETFNETTDFNYTFDGNTTSSH